MKTIKLLNICHNISQGKRLQIKSFNMKMKKERMQGILQKYHIHN